MSLFWAAGLKLGDFNSKYLMLFQLCELNPETVAKYEEINLKSIKQRSIFPYRFYQAQKGKKK